MPNTRGAINLGGGNNEEPPRFSRLSEKDKADLEALAEESGTDPRQGIATMFLVIVPESGVAVAIQDPAAVSKYRPEHLATVAEMQAACHYVDARIDHSMLAQAVVTTQMQLAANVARQADDAELVRKLNLN